MAPKVIPDRDALFAQWRSMADQDLAALAATGQLPERYVNSPYVRCCNNAVMTPLCCLPCVFMSCVSRVVMCPFTCGKSWGGTVCSDGSDACILSLIKETNKTLGPTDKVVGPVDALSLDPGGQAALDARVATIREFVRRFFEVLDSQDTHSHVVSLALTKNWMLDYLVSQLLVLGFARLEGGKARLDSISVSNAKGVVAALLASIPAGPTVQPVLSLAYGIRLQ